MSAPRTRADLLQVQKKGHVVALAGEPGHPRRAAVEDRPRDVDRAAAGQPAALGTAWVGPAAATGMAPSSRRTRKASRSSGANVADG